MDTNGEVNDHNLLDYEPGELEHFRSEQTVKKAQESGTASSSAEEKVDQNLYQRARVLGEPA